MIIETTPIKVIRRGLIFQCDNEETKEAALLLFGPDPIRDFIVKTILNEFVKDTDRKMMGLIGPVA